MKNVFFVVSQGAKFYARAQDAVQARRIFARSMSAIAEKQVVVRQAQVKRFMGSVQTIGNAGYDAAVAHELTRAEAGAELRAMQRQSYMDWSYDRRKAVEISRRNIHATAFDNEEVEVYTL